MKLLFLLLLLSLSGNNPSENGIPYRNLTWSDFRGAVPENEPSVIALTATQMAMETLESDGRFKYAVTLRFLPDSSYVRVKSKEVLRHEQTHFQIAYIAFLECVRDLRPFQGAAVGPDKAERIYDAYVAQADNRNTLFDRDTDHSRNAAVEKVWEDRISQQLKNFNFGKGKARY